MLFRSVDPTDDVDAIGDDFESLPFPFALLQGPFDDDRTAGRDAKDVAFVIRQRRRRHDLQQIEARTVGKMDKGESRFRVAARAHPPLRRDARRRRNRAGNDFNDGGHRARNLAHASAKLRHDAIRQRSDGLTRSRRHIDAV